MKQYEIPCEALLNMDARGWYGPLLLLKVKGFLDQLEPGQTGQVIGSYDCMGKEFKTLLDAMGYQIIARHYQEDRQVWKILRPEAQPEKPGPQPDPALMNPAPDPAL